MCKNVVFFSIKSDLHNDLIVYFYVASTVRFNGFNEFLIGSRTKLWRVRQQRLTHGWWRATKALVYGVYKILLIVLKVQKKRL